VEPLLEQGAPGHKFACHFPENTESAARAG
jgi:hypothetical protein